MQSARRIKATVQEGGRIEVSAPDLKPGIAVEVAIYPTNGNKSRRSVLEILAEAPGHRVFKTAQEVDAYVQAERDSWDH